MSRTKSFSFMIIVCLMASSITLAVGISEPNKPNINNDERVDFLDYSIMGENWQLAGTDLAGDFDDSNAVDINDFQQFCWYWLSQYSEYQQCDGVDLDSDGLIAFEDLSKLAQNWLLSGPGLNGDFDVSNSVDCNDLSIMADCWLKGTRSLDIWEQFKQSLRNDDLDLALTFIADSTIEQYTYTLTQLRPYFNDMVNRMGDLVLISSDDNTAKFEMLYDEGGGEISSFPVYFSKNENGEWKINCF